MKSNAIIGIIGAMDIEVETLKASIVDLQTEKIAEMEFYKGLINGKNVIVVKCGIGKVNAARCAQILCDNYNVDALVNTGIGGGIGDGLSVGDLIVGKELVQHDFDVTGFGYAKGYMFSGDTDKPTVYIADDEICALMSKAAIMHLSEEKVKCGRIATGDVFVSSYEKKKEIKDTFDALVCEMEGGAIAQCAVANGVPFAVLRSLSDLADGSASQSYEEFEKETAHLSAKIIMSFLTLF